MDDLLQRSSCSKGVTYTSFGVAPLPDAEDLNVLEHRICEVCTGAVFLPVV